MKKAIILVILSIFFTQTFAQDDTLKTKMTLSDCMIYAVANNTSVKKQNYINSNNKQDEIGAIASLAPSVRGSSSMIKSYGRSIDPGTNTYTTVENLGNGYSIYAEMPVFAGFTNINTVRMTRMSRLMGIEQLQQKKDEVALNTMKAFFNVVYYTNCVQISEEQLSTSIITLEQSKKMEELGLKSVADVALVESQVASDELTLIQQKNLLENSLLALKEQMNYPVENNIEVDTGLTGIYPISDEQNNHNLAWTIDYAIANNPQMRASEYNLRTKELNYNIVMGDLLPAFYLQGGYSTNFHRSLGKDAKYSPFKQQLKDNQGHYFGAYVSIPVFNGLKKQVNLGKARNNVKIAEQENTETERAIRTEITKTALEREGYKKEQEMASRKTEASALAHKASLQKYSQGLIGPIELQTTANQLMQAKSQKLNALLQYIIRCKMMEYYSGNALIK